MSIRSPAVSQSQQNGSASNSPSPAKSRSSANAMTLLKRESLISDSFVEYQRVNDALLSTTDVHFLCADGVVPAHAFLLKTISPFFNKMFQMQGMYYPFQYRSIIIPDYSVMDVTRFVQFIYTGWANVPKSDVEKIKEMLKLFDINVKPEKIVVEDVPVELKKEDSVLYYNGQEAADLKLFSANRVLTSPLKRKSEEGTPTVSKKIVVTKKGEGSLDKEVVVVIPRDKNIKPQPPLAKKTVIPNSKPVNSNSEDGNVSSTDTSEDEMDENLCKDAEKFLREARRCQKCKKSYKTPSEASLCLTSHQRLRCYLCFKVVRNTEKLFTHFAKRHKKAGRDQSLLCGFCDQIIPYKSVSCHVISLHLTDNQNASTPAIKQTRNIRGGGGRPLTISSVHTNTKTYEASKKTTITTEKSGGGPTKKGPSAGSGSAEVPSTTTPPGTSKPADAGEKDWTGDHVLKSQKIEFKNIIGQHRVFEVRLIRTNDKSQDSENVDKE